jgi:branched-chain amino acid transport system permease protein
LLLSHGCAVHQHPRPLYARGHGIVAVRGRPYGGGALNVFQLETILYGLLIIGFLIFEPRGLYGI